jgi:L-asparaginase type II
LLSVLSILATAEEVPEVVILATGGTIAGAGDSSISSSYKAAKLPIEKLLNSVPEIHALAEISGEQVAQVASQAITTKIWLELARRVEHHLSRPAVAGIVITHGTDTMEETAYFLDLVIDSDKPIVLVGSMRPPTSLSSDGARNLYNAVAVAASPDARRYGALIVMNDSILSARDATKSNTTAVNTFVARGKGPVGHVELGKPTFYQPAGRRHSPFNIGAIKSLPSVDIVYGYANASPTPVNALVAGGSKGVVYAGVGNGNLFPAVETALAKARKSGVIVVRSTRVGSGHVLRNAEVDDDALDFIVADDLSPQKARILLMLALTKTSDSKRIQEWYFDL